MTTFNRYAKSTIALFAKTIGNDINAITTNNERGQTNGASSITMNDYIRDTSIKANFVIHSVATAIRAIYLCSIREAMFKSVLSDGINDTAQLNQFVKAGYGTQFN